MAATSKIEFTNLFADDSTLKISVDNIRPENLGNSQVETIKTRVQQFNSEQGGELAPKMKSKNGFNWIGIKAVRIVTTDKTYIF